MRLRIRASETRVTGAERRLTRTLRFSEGLNLVRAENNMGKTTVLMTILYALVLPMLFSARTRLSPSLKRRVLVRRRSAPVTLVSLARIRSLIEPPFQGGAVRRPG